MEFILNTHKAVFVEANSEWEGGIVYFPIGERGEDILKRIKQTEAERIECQKRGANA
jgi:hypothetical protein